MAWQLSRKLLFFAAFFKISRWSVGILTQNGYSKEVAAALERCEKHEQIFCHVGSPPYRDTINQLIEGNGTLLRAFNQMRGVRPKRSTSARQGVVSCSSVCCVRELETEPMSFFRDYDGWSRVASTPEFPQRTIIRIAKCANKNAKCRGLVPKDRNLRPTCVQVTRRHRLLLYNATAKFISSSWVELPSGCNCQLKQRFFPAVQTETTTRLI